MVFNLQQNGCFRILIWTFSKKILNFFDVFQKVLNFFKKLFTLGSMAQKVTFYCKNLNSIGVIVFELCALQLFGRCPDPRFFGAGGKNLNRFFLILVPKDAQLPDLTITYYFG